MRESTIQPINGQPTGGAPFTWGTPTTGSPQPIATPVESSPLPQGSGSPRPSTPPPQPLGMTPPNFKIAFLGDQGADSGAENVLRLIKKEGADLVLHQGDTDYEGRHETWDSRISSILGEDFPYLVSAGNHDMDNEWDGYQTLLEKRIARIPDLKCTGTMGLSATCLYKGVWVVISAIGSYEDAKESYIQDSLAESGDYIWKVCSWHKTMRDYQVGGKSNEISWEAYRICKDAGAIIAQGHEHSYNRTVTMKNFERFEIESPSKTELTIKPGATFLFTQGLGGINVRSQSRCTNNSCPYMASIYTSTQGAKVGALFCELNKDGQENKAHCYFKNIEDKIIDEFNVTAQTGQFAAGTSRVKQQSAFRAIRDPNALFKRLNDIAGPKIKIDKSKIRGELSNCE